MFVAVEGAEMIKDYVADMASQMGIEVTHVSLAGGLKVACVDYRLEIYSKSHVVSTLIHMSELETIKNRSSSGFLELKIRTALERLKLILEP
jgi:hypothetical protein